MEKHVTCKTFVISRGKNANVSAVAGAAYRSGQNLLARGIGPDGSDKMFRYSNRASVVRETLFMTPEDDGPDYLRFSDVPSTKTTRLARAQLWNEIEEMEKGKTARLGRELQLGFAHELSHDEQRELVKQFVRERFTEGGTTTVRIHGKPVEVQLSFVADIAIHNYGRAIPFMGASEEQREKLSRLAANGYTMVEREEAEGLETPHIRIERNRDGDVTGHRVYQPHAHVRLSPRVVVDGEWAKNKHASRALNTHEACKNWRYEWPALQNEYLERKGCDVRVTCTADYEDQYPDIRFLSTGRSHEQHHMEQRADSMPEAARASHDEAQEKIERYEEFKDLRNAALVKDAEDTAAPKAGAPDREAVRVTTWWRNMSERFSTWRSDFTDKAQEWRERFAAQDWRLKSVIGWHAQNHEVEPTEPPPDTPEPPQQEQGEPDR